MDDKKILIPTSIVDHDDIKARKVFISRSHCGKHYYDGVKTYDDVIIDDQFSNPSFYNRVQEDSDKLYNILEPAIAKGLNDIHSADMDYSFWHSFLYMWLNRFMFYIVLRRNILLYIKQKYNKISILVKNEPCKVLSSDLDFITSDKDDRFSFHIFSKLAKILYASENIIAIDENKLKDNIDGCALINLDKEIKTSIVSTIKKVCRKPNWLVKKIYAQIVKKFFSPEVIIDCPNFPGIMVSDIIISSRGKVQSVRSSEAILSDVCIDFDFRSEILSLVEKHVINKMFDRTLLKIIIEEMPTCFVENFANISNKYKLVHNVKYIISYQSWVIDVERFYWMLAQRNKVGTRLFAVQHGGNYFIQKNLYTEMDIADGAFSWGECGYGDLQGIVSPAFKMRNYPINSEKEYLKHQKILYCGTEVMSFGAVLGQADYLNIIYVQRQLKFLKALSENTRNNVKIRNYKFEFNWPVNQYLTNMIPTLNIERYFDVDSYKNIYEIEESLQESRLCICDHISTVWLEALYMNVPLVMVFDEKYCRHIVRPSAMRYIRLLRGVGIIQYSVEEAAHLVNEIYENIDAWWMDIKRQRVIKIIRKKYIYLNANNAEIWYKNKINEILRSE
ncbi:MAG: LIC12162 family protein [Lachnospiraceae bacterium]|nr:LIC12162 family protein [Lachnospiraceae bacterium]